MHAPTIQRVDTRLEVDFLASQRMLSWALHRGGYQVARRVVWQAVRNADLTLDTDPGAWLRDHLGPAGCLDAVAMMTSGNLDRYVVERARIGEAQAACIATVGLSNALRVGDPASPAPGVGTINLLCWLSRPLDPQAMLEALSIAAEARTLAVYESGVASVASGERATGTGTDCIVIASPDATPAVAYAGKHTMAGSLVGQVVGRAIARGVAEWRARAR